MIVPPVFIDPSATVKGSVIGPYASIGAGCTIKSCIIRESIIDDNSVVTDVILENSLIGQEVHIQATGWHYEYWGSHRAGVYNPP